MVIRVLLLDWHKTCPKPDLHTTQISYKSTRVLKKTTGIQDRVGGKIAPDKSVEGCNVVYLFIIGVT